jgi:hypothetical protein
MPTVFSIETPNNGTIHVAQGAQISSSDFGKGSLEVRSYLLQLVCMNGMVGESAVREIHLGKRLNEADFTFSAETYRRDTETMVSAIGDITGSVFGDQYRERLVRQVTGASAQETTMDNVAKSLPKMGVQKEELDAINEILGNSMLEDGVQGRLTNWKVTQAITAHARHTNPQRARELQEIAGSMLPKLVEA